ncbi:MAG: leucine-rich repeat domain-containing protein [Bacteroidetes bacterium]|nr:leucine-rich repeat domain-containing protein [Bacteroidota bacterium]
MKKIYLLLFLSLIISGLPVMAQTKTTTKKSGTSTSGQAKKKTGTGTQKKSGTTVTKKNGPNGKTVEVKSKAGMIAANKIDTFKLQVTPLVKFFESSLNFLADPRNAVNEKQTILSQSYLKWCWDEEVQIEDDLDENRLVPLYKDMPAYLSDVSFFFKSAKFNYSVQDVSVEAGQDGLTYFRVTANRNLRGLTLNSDSVNSNKVRYIEMNFDSVKQQMKIVSVYTTKLNEKDDMRNWWNGLSQDWKAVLAADMKLEGSMPMASIDSFNDSVAMVGGQKTPIMGSEFYQFLNQIVHAGRVDLSGNKTIVSVEPLNKLSDLKEVNISGTGVSDLMPMRNLNKMEILDISNTAVTTLEPLHYCIHINQLRMKGTAVSDLSVVPVFQSLNMLDISGTRVNTLDAVTDMTTIKDLRASHTSVKDIGPLASLVNLELLNISSTQVDNLDALKNLVTLRILLSDSTGIKSLAPLENLTALQRVYCNNTGITQKEALNFIKKHPEASLVYASKELAAWWKGMTPEWQNQFNFYLKFDNQPNTEQLHQLALLDSISIVGRVTMTTLAPLSKLILLRNLQCQSTGITSLDPLKDLTELKVLNASNTKVADLKPLSGIAGLETLSVDNTQVADLSPLYGLTKLQFVFADNTPLDVPEADKFAGKNPGCMLVFQTGENTEWWQGLSQPWKDVLLDQVGIKGTPDKIQLQQVAGLSKVVVSENFQISDLNPLLHLSRLTELQFSGTSVSKLDPVTRMPKLKVLRCTKNPVLDLTPVTGLPNLTELDFSNTQVEDIDALQNMMQLEVLKFNGTQVKNLKYLQKLVNMKVMEFYNTRVGNVDVLDGMTKLESVKMFNTKVSAKRVEKLKMAHPNCEIVFY